MKRFVLLFSVTIVALAAQPVAVVDLTGPHADFPTNRVSVIGCQPAFDSPLKDPPASCAPFPVKLEVKGERPIVSPAGGSVLEVVITNESGRAIDLPVSPKEPKRGGKEQFISLAIYSLPVSQRSNIFAYAFADTNDVSSAVTVGPGQNIVYIIPFDKKALKPREGNAAHKVQICVELTAYSVARGQRGSDDVSTQRGNRIVSGQFTPSD